MKKALITVIQEHIFDEQIKQLEAILCRNYVKHVSSERLIVIWCKIPAEQVWTNYQPSRSSIVTIECANGFPQQQRVALLKSIAAEWGAVTHQHPDELMLALADADLFGVMLASNRERLAPIGRLKMVAQMATSLLVSRLRHGFLAFSPNL